MKDDEGKRFGEQVRNLVGDAMQDASGEGGHWNEEGFWVWGSNLNAQPPHEGREMDEKIENMQSIELPFRASVDYEDGDASRPRDGQFIGSGRLHCPICGNERVDLRPAPALIDITDERTEARLDFSCNEGYGHSITLEVAAVAPGEIIWVLTATDDAYDMRETLKHEQQD
jgi:hypothetical protein